MTPDNAPTVITAAEFVSGGYAAKVAAGECVVIDQDKDFVINATKTPSLVMIEYLSRTSSDFVSLDPDEKLTVRWFPATDELASLRAQVARYRAALEAIVSSANAMETKSNRYPQNDALLHGAVAWSSAARVARDALAETEEA